eukprot:4935959-Alexandrium_andersonii.AAC.1
MSASLVGSEMCIRDSRYARAEIHQGRLVVRLEQDFVEVPQPVYASHRLVHSVLVQATLAQDWAR